MNKGNTVLIIEHNMDVIKIVDHIIDIGYEGGKNGGKLLLEEPRKKLVKTKKAIQRSF